MSDQSIEREPLVYDGKWAEVCYAIDELEWYVSRRIDLKGTSLSGREWSEAMAEDIKDLRKAIEDARRG